MNLARFAILTIPVVLAAQQPAELERERSDTRREP